MRLSGQPFCKRLVDHRIEPALLGDHAADDVAEERGLRRQVFVALDLAADPVALEFRQASLSGVAARSI